MPNDLLGRLSSKQLHHAAALRERIDALESELARLLAPGLAPGRAASTNGGVSKPKRTFSAAARALAAARARMAAAARARWAKAKAAGRRHL